MQQFTSLKSNSLPGGPLRGSEIGACLDRGLPGAKEKLFPGSFYHLDLEIHTFFSRLLVGKCTCLLSPELSSGLCLRLVAAYDCFMMSLKSLDWGARLFQLDQENISFYRIVVDTEIKFESKGILDFFLTSLIPLQLRQTNKKITSEWGKKKKQRSMFTNPRISQRYQLFTTTTKTLSSTP